LIFFAAFTTSNPICPPQKREKDKLAAQQRRKSVNKLEKRISRKLDQGTIRSTKKYASVFFADFEKICTSEEAAQDRFPDMLRFPENDVAIIQEPRVTATLLEDHVPAKKWPSVEKNSPHWLRESFAVFARKNWTLLKFNASNVGPAAAAGVISSQSAPSLDIDSKGSAKKRSKKIRGSKADLPGYDDITLEDLAMSPRRASVEAGLLDSSETSDAQTDSITSSHKRKMSNSVSSDILRSGSGSSNGGGASIKIATSFDKAGRIKAKNRDHRASITSSPLKERVSGEMPSSEVDRAVLLGYVPSASNIQLPTGSAGAEGEAPFEASPPARHLMKSTYRNGLFTHYNTMQKTLGIQEIMDFNRSRVHSPFEFLGTPKRTQFLIELRDVQLPVAPLFCTIALHDISTRTKITEDFHWELNSKQGTILLDRDSEAASAETRTQRALFTITGDSLVGIYMVIRVHRLLVPDDKEKYLSEAAGIIVDKKGKDANKRNTIDSPGQPSDPGVRFNSQYTQPYCWAAAPLNVGNATMLSTAWAVTQALGGGPVAAANSSSKDDEKDGGDSDAIMAITPIATAASGDKGVSAAAVGQSYTVGPFSLSKSAPLTDDIYDLLANEKEMRKLKTFPGQVVLRIAKVGFASSLEEELQGCQVDPSLVPVQPFDPSCLEAKKSSKLKVVRQIQEFGTCRDFFLQYVNNLYIYVKSGIFKQREKADLQVEIRLRDNDKAPKTGVPLGKLDAMKAIFGRSFQPNMNRSQRTDVQLHDKKSGFNDEFKIRLPVQIGPEHHLLFVVYDVDIKKNKETVIGFGIVPLFLDGRPNLPLAVESLPIYPELPDGYLLPNVQAKLRSTDLSKKSSLNFSTRLVSSIYSQDQRIADFFHAYDPSPPAFGNRVLVDENKLAEAAARERQYCSVISALQRASRVYLFRHFSVLLTMLLKIICAQHQSDTVGREAFLCMVHLVRTVTEHTSGKYSPFIRAYISCLFDHSFFGAGFFPPFEALVRFYNMLVADRDPLIVNFDSHWFLFCLITKSMALQLNEDQTLSNAVPRTNRFSEDFVLNLQKLLRALLCEHNVRGGLDYTMAAALFVKDLFSLVDRGIVMSVIHEYLGSMRGEGSGPLMETFKFAFLKILTNYEHFVQLNLPLPVAVTRGVELSVLAQRLKEKHFLVGQLIEETRRHYVASRGEDILRNQAIICLRTVMAKQEALFPFSDAYENVVKEGELAKLPLPTEKEKLLLKRHARLAAMYLPYVIHVIDDPSPILSDAIMKSKEKEEWLICIIFFLRYCSRKLITAWWLQETQKRQANLFLLLEQCVKTFDTGAISKQVDLVVAEFIGTITENCALEINEVTSDLQASPLLKRIVVIFMELFKKIDDDNGAFIQHYAPPMHQLLERCTKGLLHESSTDSLGSLGVEFLRQMNHPVKVISQFGATMMYLLVRRVHAETGSYSRMKTEIVVSMSKMVNNAQLAPLVASLASMKLYAIEHESPSYSQGIEDTISAAMTLLELRSRIERHKSDPEMMQELYYNISKSYMSNPELRVTWLDNLAQANVATEDFEEAAQAKILIASIVARYLMRPHPKNANSFGSSTTPGRKLTQLGKEFANFPTVSPNAHREPGLEEAPNFDSDNWNLKYLIFNLKEAVSLFARATRWELSLEVYSVLTQIHKSQKKYGDIVPVLKEHKDLCERLVDVANPIERLYPVYFRVAFFGTKWQEQNGKEYIYKKTARWNLSTFKKQLEDQFKSKFDPGELVVLSTNEAINPAKLDATKSYIQMTGVTPYFEADEIDDRVTKPEQNFRVHQFLFETGYSDDGSGGTTNQLSDDLSRQRKKKTIFVTSHMFPHIFNRLEIISKREILLSPIENAIELLKGQVGKLRQELESFPTRVKSLQQVIQGSVVPMVNPGPLKILEIFLSAGVFRDKKYSSPSILELMDVMDKFVKMCGFAIKLNKSLIDETQIKFQQMVEKFYGEMSDKVRVAIDTLRVEHKACPQ
jgi:hypothetical protein